jgi:recombination associated protein RdgC
VGALRGSIGYAKFHVRGELPENFPDKFAKAVRLRAFRPLVPSDEDEQRAGWCSIHHPFDLDLDHAKIYANEYLNLGLRIDRWRIPSAVLKAHLADAEAARLEQTGQKRLSKTQRDEVRTMVVRKLREQFMPAMRTIDLSWNLNTGVVRFFSHSTAVHDALTEVFETTFKPLSLVIDGVYVRAENLKMPPAALDALAQLDPTPFHFEPNR